MSGYKKFSDSWRTSAERDPPQTLAPLATLAGVHAESENVDRHGTKNDESPQGAAKAAKAAKVPQTLATLATLAGVHALEACCPDHVDVVRWQQCLDDGHRFLATWGEQAEALGWTAADLFGLHTPPEKPHPSYNRLSKYDGTGLIWLLEGRPVVALTEATAAIENPTGNITVYRKHNKPALGPVGDSMEDFK